MTRKAPARPLQALNRDLLVAWALIGLVYVLGDRIPLPGIGADATAFWFETAVGELRWSILFLGLEPFLTVLLVVEILKLLSPRFYRWSLMPRDGLIGPRTVIVALALLVAIYQATEFHEALVLAEVASAADMSRLVMVATLIAGVATLWFLAERVEVPGLALGGFWLVVSVSWIGSLGAWFAHLIEMVRIGAMDERTLAALSVLAGAAVAAVALSATVLRSDVEASGGDPIRWSGLLLWPPLLAESMSNLVAGWTFAVLPDPPATVPSPYSVAWVACFCLVLPVLTVLHARSIMDISARGRVWKARRALLVLLALVQTAICCLFQLLPEFTSAEPIQGTTLIVVVATMAAAVRTTSSAYAERTRRAINR